MTAIDYFMQSVDNFNPGRDVSLTQLIRHDQLLNVGHFNSKHIIRKQT